MRSFKLKELKMFVHLNMSENISDKHGMNSNDIIPEKYKVIGTSSGIYGINGALFEGIETGKTYAITKRCGNLLMLV